ncbi:unnamed protein product [Discula destructiva]
MTVSVKNAGLHPAFYVLSWMFFSNLTIIFNKWLIGTAGFTIILTTIHLFTTVLFTQILARFTSLLPLPSRPVLTRRYIWYILSIGLCYTASLLSSNMAYLTLSVSFISMLKSLAPVTTLVISYAGGFSDPSTGTWVKVSIITFGVFLSSIGEVTFAWDGFTYQMFGTVSESLRLLLIGWLLATPISQPPTPTQQKAETSERGFYDADDEDKQEMLENVTDANESARGDKAGTGRRQSNDDDDDDDVEAQGAPDANVMANMSPLVLLYYYAPVCAVFNMLMSLMTEWRTFNMEDLHRVGWVMLALNGAVAFMLNVSSVFLIGKTSALAMNLTGILKSVLLVFASILIWNTPITFIQAGGYGIALIGLLVYALPEDALRQSELAEVVLTHAGVYAVKIGNRLGFLGFGNTWGSRFGGAEGRYASLPDGSDDRVQDESFPLNGVETDKPEMREADGLERKEKIAND